MKHVKKQSNLFKHVIKSQAFKLFHERRKNRAKRDFLDSMVSEELTQEERERSLIIITNCLIRVRNLWTACGPLAAWDVIGDNTPFPTRNNDYVENCPTCGQSRKEYQ